MSPSSPRRAVRRRSCLRVLTTFLVVVAAVGCGRYAQVERITTAPGVGDAAAIELLATGAHTTALDTWAHKRATTLSIPMRAARAYGYAAIVVAEAQPECHVGWTTLAGIAKIESDHGRFRGATITAEGWVRPVIRGVALDGTNGNARIVDPQATARAEQTVFARAAGPFQFIPDTWQRWGIRAGVGRESLERLIDAGKTGLPKETLGSPDNIDDAALAAARYLCASGGDLSTSAGWRKAIFSYNHSDAYVAQVHAAASSYATR